MIPLVCAIVLVCLLRYEVLFPRGNELVRVPNAEVDGLKDAPKLWVGRETS
jgi:hypothetical protein